MIWLLALLLFGCSTSASDLALKQRQIQDCILSGGHARLGSGHTILCEGSFQ